jgi:hypothetical protein
MEALETMEQNQRFVFGKNILQGEVFSVLRSNTKR